jgi:hypothetical protein
MNSKEQVQILSRWKEQGMIPLNPIIAAKLENYFKHRGIAAYTRCCRFGCTSTYADDLDWDFREQGIYFVRLSLSGMNYEPLVKSFYAYYSDFAYLKENWEQEKAYLLKYCEILGYNENECTITFPDDENKTIAIQLNRILVLDAED